MNQEKEKSTPAPLETGPGQQQDDNIDDMGRRDDGKKQDQPTDPNGSGKSDKSKG
jgi:hypothetical protein